MSQAIEARQGSSAAILAVMTTLINTGPTLIPALLASHAPFRRPSSLPSSEMNKFLNRLSGKIVQQASGGSTSSPQRSLMQSIAKEVIKMDEEGVVIGMYGRVWVQHLFAGLATVSPEALPAHLDLLILLIVTSPRYPAFHRESILPIIVKVSQALVNRLKKDESQASLVLGHLAPLLRMAPTPHRPLVPLLLPILHKLLLTADFSTRRDAIHVLATLHILPGKVAASQAWRMDLLQAIREAEVCVDGILRGALTVANTSVNGDASNGSITQGIIGEDDGQRSREEMIDVYFTALDGWLRLIIGLMTFDTARPVAFPLGSVVGLVLRCLSLTPETPLSTSLDSSHHAALLSVFPRMWALASQLLGHVVLAVGDHLLPSLTRILEQSVFLLETLPAGASHTSRLGLLRLHTLLLSKLDVVPAAEELHVRLIKSCISTLRVLLEERTDHVSLLSSGEVDAAADTDKRSKKRRRDAIEDALVGGMEGKVVRTISRQEGQVTLAALDLLAILHPHPAIPPHVLAMSLRFLLSLSLAASSASLKVIVQDYPTFDQELVRGLQDVLEAAMYLEGGSGSQRPWLGLIAVNEQIGQSAQVGSIIHPSQPPLSRPLPPMSSLAFYSCESDQEKELREELGLAVESDPVSEAPPAKVRHLSPPLQQQQQQSVVVQAPAPPPEIPSIRDLGSSKSAVSAPLPATALHKTPSSAAAIETVAADVEMVEAVATDEVPVPVAQAESSASFMSAPKTAITATGTSSVKEQSTIPVPVSTTAREGVKYDSEGEEMPEINLESDTDEDEDEGDDDM